MLNKLSGSAAAFGLALAGAIATKSGYLDLSMHIQLEWPAAFFIEVMLHTVRDTTIALLALVVFGAITHKPRRGSLARAVIFTAIVISGSRLAYILFMALAPPPAYGAAPLFLLRYTLQFVPLLAGVSIALWLVSKQAPVRQA